MDYESLIEENKHLRAQIKGYKGLVGARQALGSTVEHEHLDIEPTTEHTAAPWEEDCPTCTRVNGYRTRNPSYRKPVRGELTVKCNSETCNGDTTVAYVRETELVEDDEGIMHAPSVADECPHCHERDQFITESEWD